MYVKCDQCNKRYDDAHCWVLCPHNPLERGADEPYCREHDLFSCTLAHDSDREMHNEVLRAVSTLAHQVDLVRIATEAMTAYMGVGGMIAFYLGSQDKEALTHINTVLQALRQKFHHIYDGGVYASGDSANLNTSSPSGAHDLQVDSSGND